MILAKEQAQANHVKELAARDRAKNEELEDKTMRLALIEAEGIKYVVLDFLCSLFLVNFSSKVSCKQLVIITPICRRKQSSVEAEAS